MDDWEVVDPNAFRDTGLLYMVNKTVLWPMGLVLRVTYSDNIEEQRIDLVMLKDPETIDEGRIDVTKEPGGCHPQERFLHYAESRVLLMPTEMEREMAAKALRKIIPGFGISPIRK